MILFRARQYGQPEWALLSVNVPGDEDDETEVIKHLQGIIGSALGTSGLHVQLLNDDGIWEDME